MKRDNMNGGPEQKKTKKTLSAEEESEDAWLACLQVQSDNEKRILKPKMQQQRPCIVAHLNTCLQVEWDKITPKTLSLGVFSP